MNITIDSSPHGALSIKQLAEEEQLGSFILM